MEQILALINAMAGIASLLLIVAFGFFLARKGHLNEPVRKFIPHLITNFSLPALLIWTMLTYFEKDTLLPLMYSSLLPTLVMGIIFCTAWFIGKYYKIERKHLGLFCACSSNPNTIYIGVPVTAALFGPDNIHYVLLYYVASTTFFWTVGSYAISKDVSSINIKSTFSSTLKKIFSPPIRSFIFALCLLLADLKLPDFLMSTAKQLGYLTTPLALLFIGANLAIINFKKIKLSRDITLALVLRMIISPFLTALLLPLFALPPVMGKIFIIQASLPVLMQAAILSAYYGADAEYGSIMVSLSTILSSLTIPILAYLLSFY